jgi:hypothetical protein
MDIAIEVYGPNSPRRVSFYSSQHMNIVENDHHFIRLRLSCKLLNPTLRSQSPSMCGGGTLGYIHRVQKGSVQGYKVLVNSMQSTKCYELTGSRKSAL